MVDLETLDVSPGAVITSIGVVEFDLKTGKTFREFYKTIDIQSSLDKGFTISGETLKWWMNQPNRLEMFKDTEPLEEVLENLTKFFGNELQRGKNILWGNGSSFDLGILGFAYRKLGKTIPWKFWNERDVRTLVSLAPHIKNNMRNSGTVHHPLDDCKFQIMYCNETYYEIFNK